MGLLKLCSLKCSAGTAPQCLALNPCVCLAPALTWALLCTWRCTGVTCHSSNMHFASLGRLLRFWISEECQSPLRVFFPFSLFSFPFFSPSHIQFELQDSFQVFLHFVRTGKRLRELVFGFFFCFFFKTTFISPFSTINCLHVLQCSFSPNPNQKVSQMKANRS